MQRRALLASLGGLAGGCLGAPASGGSTTASPTATVTSPTTGAASDAEYRIADLSVSTESERPDVNYVLETRAFYSADAVERERERLSDEVVVTDVSEIDDPAVRDVIEAALREGEWRGDEHPDGLADLVERVDFFTGVPKDDTYTHIGLELYELAPDRPPAIEFDAAIVDDRVAPESPGALEFSLANTGRETQEVFSGTVPPFGMVTAERDGGSFLLWRDYEDEGCYTFTDDGWFRCDIGIVTPIEPGEAVIRRYEVLPATTAIYPDLTAPPEPGRYEIAETVSYSTGSGAPSSTLAGRIEFELQERG